MNNNVPWIEKYRPKKPDDIILDEIVMNKVKKIIEDKDMPNLIITGIPGIGKTTTIKCIARGLYGKYAKDAVLEINASDDRGIRAVQDTIITFCKKKLDLNDNDSDDKFEEIKKEKKYSEHKIIILDEGDNMTPKAQALINNLMERYHNTTRFAFTCNNSSDILESIQSRCIVLRYKRLKDELIAKKLMSICAIEEVKYEENSLETVASLSQGDLRAAINNLQLIYNSFGEILNSHIYKICDKPQPDLLNKLFDACMSKNFKAAIRVFMYLKDHGFMESDIILNMLAIIRQDKSHLDEKSKMIFLEKIGYYAYIISKGFDSPIQLEACIASIISAL